MSIYLEPRLFADGSVIENTIIRDSEIFQNVGYKNYIQLHRKYPGYFKYFSECDNITDGIGHVPSPILLYTCNDPKILKSDIVKTIYYKKWFSENSNLVLECKDKIICRPTEFENTTSIWIFICIIIVTLIFFAVYILAMSPHADKLLNLSNYELNIPYYINNKR